MGDVGAQKDVSRKDVEQKMISACCMYVQSQVEKEVNGLVIKAETIEGRYGEQDNLELFQGLQIETTAQDHLWGFDPNTSEGIRVVNGKKIKGDSEIMKKEYEDRISAQKVKKSESKSRKSSKNELEIN